MVRFMAVLGGVVVVGMAMLGQMAGAQEAGQVKVRELMQKQQSGEALTAEEQQTLDKAQQARQGSGRAGQAQQGRQGGRSAQGGRGRQAATTQPANGQTIDGQHADDGGAVAGKGDSVGLVPLTDMTEPYKGFDGGLYGAGLNQPTSEHQAAIQPFIDAIQPLNAEGQPDPNGKIVLAIVGMSNTWREGKAFKELADKDPDKSPAVVIIPAGQPGMDVEWWSAEDKINNFNFTPDGIEKGQPVWSYIDKQLADAGLSARQVQVLWVKQAKIVPQRNGAFPAHNKVFQDLLTKNIQVAAKRYPNLKVAFFSSRIYAGYSLRGLSPEPFAYENAFGIRQLILDQLAGKAELNFEPAKGEVKAPVALWGPYLWADGLTPRKVDGLTWKKEDFDTDMTHPSFTVGAPKVAKLLLDFLKSDPNAKGWFVKQ